MTNRRWTSEATDETFGREVIERSYQLPVLVDFWAGWCAPCRMLGPVVEAAVEAREGQVWLVKVDVEGSRGVAARYGVQGIPVVKAFVDGQVVDEFVGALDRLGVDAFIDRVCPSAEDRALAAAGRHLEEGRPEAVAATVDPLLGSPVHRDAALLLLARAQAATGQVDEARKTLAQVAPGSPERERADAMALQMDLLAAAAGADEAALRGRLEASPDDVEAWWSLAGLMLASSRVPEALDALLEVLKRDRSYQDDGARRAMLAIFESIGINHELSGQYRKQMQIYM